jgi:hypothetical protein
MFGLVFGLIEEAVRCDKSTIRNRRPLTIKIVSGKRLGLRGILRQKLKYGDSEMLKSGGSGGGGRRR